LPASWEDANPPNSSTSALPRAAASPVPVRGHDAMVRSFAEVTGVCDYSATPQSGQTLLNREIF
jgi:hypothetical protein